MGMADASDAADVASDVPSIDTGADASLDLSDVRVDVPMDIAPDVNCDADGDGHRAVSCGGDDCDDANPDAHPGALEYCDGIDENCDGVADQTSDGGFDPAADMTCATGYGSMESGPVTTPTHCYVRESIPRSTPCGELYPTFGLGGECVGCWRQTATTGNNLCTLWCVVGGGSSCGTTHCP